MKRDINVSGEYDVLVRDWSNGRTSRDDLREQGAEIFRELLRGIKRFLRYGEVRPVHPDDRYPTPGSRYELIEAMKPIRRDGRIEGHWLVIGIVMEGNPGDPVRYILQIEAWLGYFTDEDSAQQKRIAPPTVDEYVGVGDAEPQTGGLRTGRRSRSLVVPRRSC